MSDHPPYFDAIAYGHQAQGAQGYANQPQTHPPPQAHSHSASTNESHHGQQGQGSFRHPSSSRHGHGMHGGSFSGEESSHVGYQYPSHTAHTHDPRMQPQPMPNYAYRPDYDYPGSYISPPQSTHPADPSPDIPAYGSTPYMQSPALNPPNFSLDRSQGGPSRHSHMAQGMDWPARMQSGGEVMAGQGRATPPVRGAAGTPSDTECGNGKGKRAVKDDERVAGRTSIGAGLMGPPSGSSGAHIERDMLLLQGYLNEIITLLPPYCANPSSASDTPNTNPSPADAAVPSQSTSTPTATRAPPPKPPKYLLARFARLSSQIKTALLTLGPHVSLASGFDPIPKRTERKMTRAEEEMENIRRRRDALLAKAREAGAAGVEAGPARFPVSGPAQGQGSASGSRNPSRANSVMGMDGRTSAPPLAEAYLPLEMRDDARQNMPPVGAEGIRRDSDMFTGSTDWPMPMRDYMAMPAGGQGYGMGGTGVDGGIDYAERLPDLLFDPSQPEAYGRMSLPLDMTKNGLPNDGETSLPPFMFPMAPHGDGSMSTPPSASLPPGNASSNGMPFDMAQLSDMAFSNGTGTANTNVPAPAQMPEGTEIHGIQMRENIAWLARTTQPPQPSIQSQTNGMMDRCHGCGVMTGEWMRGPDGPGSLCVSCGLHYAKLAKRKLTAEVAGPGP